MDRRVAALLRLVRDVAGDSRHAVRRTKLHPHCAQTATYIFVSYAATKMGMREYDKKYGPKFTELIFCL